MSGVDGFGGPEPGPAPVDEFLQSRPREQAMRRMPAVVARAVRLVWDAAGRRLLASALLQAVAGATSAVQLLAARSLLDSALAARAGDDGFAPVLPALLVLLVAVAVGTAATVVQSEHQRILGELVLRHVQGRIADVAASVDLEAFERPAFFDRLQRAQLGGQMRPWQMTMGLLSLASSGLALAGVAFALVSIEPLLIALACLAYVPLGWASVRNGRATHEVMHELTPADRERVYLWSLLVGRPYAKELRLFGSAPFLRRRHDVRAAQRLRRLELLRRRRARRSLAASLLGSLLAVGVVGLLVALLLGGRLDVAAATTAAVGLQQLGARLQTIHAGVGGLLEGSLFLDDFEAFTATRRSDAPSAPPAVRRFSVLELRGVGYTYPEARRPALAGVDVVVRRGELVALVGENGSGKTTVAKLICGLHVPTTGQVLLDGVGVEPADRAALRATTSCVFQDFARFELTAHDNIAMGLDEAHADVERVRRVAARAGADDFLAGLPDGYATRLGRQFRGGVELSTGQWQRVALARALFREASLLVLDEPTASLDARAEDELLRVLRSVARHRAVVLISHRLSSVRAADRIVVLAEGRSVEQGTHAELVHAGGRYATLFSSQVDRGGGGREPRTRRAPVAS